MYTEGSWMAKIDQVLNDDDADRLQELLAGGHLDPSSRFENGSVLGYACEHGSLKCVEVLLKSGADVNFGGRMGRLPLNRAVKGNTPGHLKIMKMLIENGAKVDAPYVTGNTPLMEAIILKGGDSVTHSYEKAMCLIRAGANTLLLNNNGDSCLHYAASRGRIQILKELLKAGMDPNITQRRGVKHKEDTGLTPLHFTAAVASEIYDLSPCARVLIDAGANINARKAGGATPLHWAANYNALTVADLLLAKGCEVDPLCEESLAEEGCSIWSTPLFLAVHCGHVAMARRLLEAGADPDFRDKNGNTPLVHAAHTHKAEMTRALIRAGCNVKVRQAGGASVLLGILRAYAGSVLTSPDDRSPLGVATMLVNAGCPIGAAEEAEIQCILQEIEGILGGQDTSEWTAAHLCAAREELRWLSKAGKSPSLKQISRLCIAEALKRNAYLPSKIFSVQLPTQLQECVAFYDI